VSFTVQIASGIVTYSVSNILDCGVVGVQLLDDGGREQAKWICDKIIAKPRQGLGELADATALFR
jgi:hypothetical protein